MSKQKYDVRRITQEVFDRWVKNSTWSNGGLISDIDAPLLNASLVPESPTAAELESDLVDRCVLHGGDISTQWLEGRAQEIRAARAREAKEAGE